MLSLASALEYKMWTDSSMKAAWELDYLSDGPIFKVRIEIKGRLNANFSIGPSTNKGNIEKTRQVEQKMERKSWL
jgi:hypothetical protein